MHVPLQCDCSLNHEVGSLAPLLSSKLGHVTCLGQWAISNCNRSRGFSSSSALVGPFSCSPESLCNDMNVPRLSSLGMKDAWKELQPSSQGRRHTKWGHSRLLSHSWAAQTPGTTQPTKDSWEIITVLLSHLVHYAAKAKHCDKVCKAPSTVPGIYVHFVNATILLFILGPSENTKMVWYSSPSTASIIKFGGS